VEAAARPPLGASMDAPLRALAGHYESGGQEFESLRARNNFNNLRSARRSNWKIKRCLER
jgi:hypothetical protein